MKRQNPRQLASGMWQANLVDANGVRSRPRYRTKAAADKAVRDSRDMRDRGELPRASQPTLREFIPAAQAAIEPRLEPASWVSYERSLRLHILPLVGDLRPHQIDPARQQRLIAELTLKGCSPASVGASYTALAVILNHAALLGLCAAPTKRILSFPRADAYEPRPTTVAEVEQLAGAIDARFSALVVVCGYAGLRLGEALALHPGDVDWAHHKIRVRATLKRATLQRGETKSHKPREVTMALRVREALEGHLLEYPNADWAFHRDGRPIDQTWFHHKAWAPARERVGLEDVRFHDLRHGAVGIMARLGGFSARRVRDEMGHSTSGFTLDRYGFYWDERDDVSRERLSDALAEAIKAAKAAAIVDGTPRAVGDPQR